MRIAYLSTDFGIPVHGNKGASIHVRELSTALTRLGHEVMIVTPRAGGDAPAGFDVPVHELAVERPERLAVAALQDDPDAGEAVAKEMRSLLYAASLRLRALPLLERFQPDAVYERYALLGTAGIELARALGIPHLLEVNAPLSEEHARHRGIGFSQTVRATERRIVGGTDHVLAVSDPLRDWIQATGVDRQRITVVPNGVDLDRFSGATARGAVRRAAIGVASGNGARPVVGFVGTLKGWHGTATLIHALALLVRDRGADRAPQLLIVGDGPQREPLVALAADLDVASLVTFTGTVPHHEVPGWITAMDIAVAPYDAQTDFYFSPLKLFEYMAASRPVVAAGIGQISDCVRNGETGVLYPPGDTEALASAIGALLDAPEHRRALGAAARREAETRFSWERNARVVADLVQGSTRVPAGGTNEEART